MYVEVSVQINSTVHTWAIAFSEVLFPSANQLNEKNRNKYLGLDLHAV